MTYSYTPLATVEYLQSLPTKAVFRDMTDPTLVEYILNAASRMIESRCDRRLAQFSGLSESGRAEGIDPDEIAEGADLPLDLAGSLGESQAASLGAAALVRNHWVQHTPPIYPDLWQGAIESVTFYRSITGSQVYDITNELFQFQADTGHMRFNIGTYLPVGSTIVTVYSGGYNPVPEDLQLATILEATRLQVLQLLPLQDSKAPSAFALDQQIDLLVSRYKRDPSR